MQNFLNEMPTRLFGTSATKESKSFFTHVSKTFKLLSYLPCLKIHASYL